MLTLYKIVVNTAYFLMLPIFWLKTLKNEKVWQQRRCLYPDRYLPGYFKNQKGDLTGPIIWAHASSMGEVRVLARLIKALEKERPQLKFCISTYTQTGQESARDIFKDTLAIFYFPLDTTFSMNRFFQRFRPDGIIIVETEIWPTFLSNCGRNEIPVVLTNGRLSEKSHHRYRRFKRSLTKLFSVYKRFAMQSEIDAERIIDIGADPDKVVITGNIKHDLVDDRDAATRRREIRRALDIEDDDFFFIAASTRPGEEEAICQALKKVNIFPEKMKALVAPRHLERLEEVISIFSKHQITYKKYSRLPADESTTDLILMDKMGHLADIFYGADIAFVGGTVADLGGHNLMEPVAAGVPVLFGPSIYNVKDASENIIAANLGRMINDARELSETLNGFAKGEIRFGMSGLKSDINESDSESAAARTARIIIQELNL